MSTLRKMKEEGWLITLHCLSQQGEFCFHTWAPSWDQLIQYFGQDFDLTGDRAPFAKLVCEMCGGRGASVIVHPPDKITGRGSGKHRTQMKPLSDEDAARRLIQIEQEFRALGVKSNEEIAAETKSRVKAQKLAAKGGVHLIGPPNPWAHRKRGRWL
jgi:hypothetical protein